MGFIINPYLFVSSTAATSVSFITSTTSTSGTISAPATVNAGDVLVIWNQATNGAGLPATVLASGFTSIVNFTDASVRKAIASYKICDGSEDSASLTIMTGTSFQEAVLMQFRGNNAITVVTPASIASQATASAPTNQTVTSGGGTPPLVVLGLFNSSISLVGPALSPAEDGGTTSGGTRVSYKIYNASPANVTVSEGDGGFNMMASCYIQVS